jgi:putative addiction module killer protein
MVEIRQTSEFKEWLLSLRDAKAKARIAARIARAASGNLGDSKPVGEGVSEMRIDYGPGYRVYYRRRGNTLVILLCGGDKSTQRSDIRRALELTRREG